MRKTLGQLFESKSVAKIEQLTPKLVVVASDLVDGRVAYRSGDLIANLLHSSAIPYLFRVWNQNDNPVIVDGGICENLPSDELELDQAPGDGPIVAISFLPKSVSPPRNIGHFSWALLSTAMENSMRRAKRRLGERVHEIDTDLTMLDFEGAVRISEDEYSKIKTAAKVFFSKLVESATTVTPPKKDHEVDPEIWKAQSLTMMETLGQVFHAQHQGSKLRYERCTLVVRTSDLNGSNVAKSDFVTYRTVFRPDHQALYCFAFTAFSQGAQFVKHRFSILDENMRAVQIAVMPFKEPDAELSHRLLVFFLPPLDPGTGPYTLEVQQEVTGFMADRKLVLTPGRAAGNIGQIDLVLHVPEAEAWAKARLVGMEGSEGRALSAAELPEGARPPDGFRGFGWRGENRPPNTQFGADLIID